MLEPLRGRIVGVVGWKDSGKTTVVESLVGLLSGKGFTVGTVKHAPGDLTLDRGAKDSLRHLDAGAEIVATVGREFVLLEKHGGQDLEDLAARYLSLLDIIVVEGFKHADIPKVVVVSGSHDILKEVENIVAVVYRDTRPDGYAAYAAGDTAGLVEFLLEKEILRPPGRTVDLMVNGRQVPMNEFVRSSLAGVVHGFITALHGVEPASTIQLTIKRPL